MEILELKSNFNGNLKAEQEKFAEENLRLKASSTEVQEEKNHYVTKIFYENLGSSFIEKNGR